MKAGAPQLPAALLDALRSEEDGDRRDEEGNEASVTTRGAVRELRYVLAGDGGEGRFWQHPPLEARPGALPPDMPFVPGVEGCVGLFRGSLFGSWTVPSAEDLEVWRARLSGLVPHEVPAWLRDETARDGPHPDPRGLAARVAGFLGADRLGEIATLLRPSAPRVTLVLERAWSALRRDADADGWTGSMEDGQASFGFRTLALRKGDRRRHLSMVALGPVPVLNLVEVAADAPGQGAKSSV